MSEQFETRSDSDPIRGETISHLLRVFNGNPDYDTFGSLSRVCRISDGSILHLKDYSYFFVWILIY